MQLSPRNSWESGWNASGAIPSRVSEVPPPLFMTTKDGCPIMAGDEVNTEQVRFFGAQVL